MSSSGPGVSGQIPTQAGQGIPGAQVPQESHVPQSTHGAPGAQSQGQGQHQGHQGVPGLGESIPSFDMSLGLDVNSDELWARLQAFYEPTPAYWGQSVGAVPPGLANFPGMAMGM